MGEGPTFRPARGPAKGAPWSLVITLIVVTALLLGRAYWPTATAAPVLVEVMGDVPKPGTYALETATVSEAVQAAGGAASTDTTVLRQGQRVIVRGTEVHVEEAQNPILVTLPVDPNTAEKFELLAIPGVSERVATAILEDREAHGPFRSLSALTRVSGIGRDSINRIEPFVAFAPVADLDLNHASAGELETLPGIGPVLAARIVVDRAENGLYQSASEVERVAGISAALAEKIAPLVAVNP